MCVTPICMNIRGLTVEVACRKCWQCVENYTNDWVGRCIAESQDAVETTVVTLTYGHSESVNAPDTDLGSKILIYSDVQKWLKRLRAAGYPLRYFLAGEYGALKGRSHWHVICFWQAKVPNYMNRVRNFTDPFWPAGYTFWDGEFDERAVYYVCKYAQKGASSKSSEMHMSKLPPLGTKYFQRRAETYARQGILPKNAFYSFPDIRVNKTGKPREFMMSGVTLDNFCSEFIRSWQERYGSHPLDVQHSEFLQKWCDDVAPRYAVETLEKRAVRFAPNIAPPEGYSAPRLEGAYNTYVVYKGGDKLFWSFDTEGKRAWQSVIRTEAQAERLRSEVLTADKYRRGRDGSTLG